MLSSFSLRHAAALGVALACLSVRAAPVLEVRETASLAAPPAAVWKLIGPFGGLHGWHPAVADTRISRGKDNVPGAVRDITVKDGAHIVEELLAYDGKGRSMRYRIVESPIPVKNYSATLRVRPEGKGSRVVWVGRFEATGEGQEARDKARALFSDIYKAGFDGLRTRLEEGGGGK